MALGSIWEALGRREDALGAYERALHIAGGDHPEDDDGHNAATAPPPLALQAVPAARALNALGLLLRGAGRAGEARPLLERSVAIRAASAGPDAPEVATALSNLGATLVALREMDRARACYARALAIWSAAGAAPPPSAADAADAASSSSSSSSAASGARYAPQVAGALTNLGLLAKRRGRASEARAFLERASAAWAVAGEPSEPGARAAAAALDELLDAASAAREEEEAEALATCAAAASCVGCGGLADYADPTAACAPAAASVAAAAAEGAAAPPA
jgi:tetratricopeptide (TPR) repeat protein